MKLLITGSDGFIGKNLCAHLRTRGYTELLEYRRDLGAVELDRYAAECDFVFHLAGVNRPDSPADFEENHTFTATLLKALGEHENKAPVLFASSAQAALENPYGLSKRRAEALLRDYTARTGAKVFIYRLPGVFGKWCRPNYNSVVATFCDAAVNDRPLHIDNPEATVALAYIDDVAGALIGALEHEPAPRGDFCEMAPIYHTTVGALATLITSFGESRTKLIVPDMGDALTTKLYSTYVSYLPEDSFSYPLTVHADARGLFAEFLKSENAGQVSVNVSKPGFIKGSHWHHTKIEKILIVSGTGRIRFQRLGGGRVTEYPVVGEKPQVIEIPPGYVHTVENTGTDDLVMVIWSSQRFDPQRPDTYPAIITS
ncbi:MAG TPA: NAD-dependent epimerase/dehydratase family protein [Clostridia bacterium]|nr:NAD-dependent epimerase/dehydratase family protein [Clostridia bacterium]